MVPLVLSTAVRKAEHLEQYFTANDIKDNEVSMAKRSILLSVCGA